MGLISLNSNGETNEVKNEHRLVVVHIFRPTSAGIPAQKYQLSELMSTRKLWKLQAAKDSNV